jgi:SnoaL-like domain
MASEITSLMNNSLFGVFGERDQARRQAAAAATYTEDVAFHDPDGTVTGRAALAAKVQGLLDSAPDFVFQPAAEVREVGDLGLLAWRFGPAAGPPAVTGTDIGLVRNGQIAALYTLVDP